MAPPKSKKRKAQNHVEGRTELSDNEDTSKPTAVYKPKRGRSHTLSIAVPGSIIANAMTYEQKLALAGTIARACAVFSVDEIIIFDDGQAPTRPPEADGLTAFRDPNFFLYHVLSYLETPPHLRRALFEMHPDLRGAGALPSLDMPHHSRAGERTPFREGVAVGPVSADFDQHTLVDCGLSQYVKVRVPLERGTRVTLHFASNNEDLDEAQAVAPDAPRLTSGYYWGYTVRQASSLSAVFTECGFDGGYDASIGTSERGAPLESLLATTADDDEDGSVPLPPDWNHLLLVFGGVAGLEVAVRADSALKAAGISEPRPLFDRWVNLVPGQGSRTIRTEEAVWLGLMGVRSVVEARNTQL